MIAMNTIKYKVFLQIKGKMLENRPWERLKKSSNRYFGLVDLFIYGVVDRLFVYVCPINPRSSLAH